jgi:hypothetical protein
MAAFEGHALSLMMLLDKDKNGYLNARDDVSYAVIENERAHVEQDSYLISPF